MARLSDKLDQLISDINEIKVSQAEHSILHRKNTDDLELHIKRTELAEARIEMLSQKDLELKEELLKEILPIKNHVDKMNIAIKTVIATLAVCGSILLGLSQMGVLSKLF